MPSSGGARGRLLRRGVAQDGVLAGNARRADYSPRRRAGRRPRREPSLTGGIAAAGWGGDGPPRPTLVDGRRHRGWRRDRRGTGRRKWRWAGARGGGRSTAALGVEGGGRRRAWWREVGGSGGGGGRSAATREVEGAAGEEGGRGVGAAREEGGRGLGVSGGGAGVVVGDEEKKLGWLGWFPVLSQVERKKKYE